MPKIRFAPAPLAFGLILLLLEARPVLANEDVAAICDAAGAQAAREIGVPLDVLRAITRTETGRPRGGRLQPWPWTVNMEGTGKWFDSRAEALAYVQAHHSRGARSYDVGCFQINYRWHGNAFDSIEDMFDPATNARYAAQFLRTLYAETGSWPKSAAAYHSRTPKYAKRYQARFERILARLGGQPPPPPSAPDPSPPTTTETVLPIEVAGPLTISPPAASRLGSTAAIETIPSGGSLLRGAAGPMF